MFNPERTWSAGRNQSRSVTLHRKDPRLWRVDRNIPRAVTECDRVRPTVMDKCHQCDQILEGHGDAPIPASRAGTRTR